MDKNKQEKGNSFTESSQKKNFQSSKKNKNKNTNNITPNNIRMEKVVNSQENMEDITNQVEVLDTQATQQVDEKIFEVKETDEQGNERRVGLASESMVNYIQSARTAAEEYAKLYNETNDKAMKLEELVKNIKDYVLKSGLLGVKWFEFKKLLTGVKEIIKMIDEFFDSRKNNKKEKGN
jgi:hypothetical protein